MRRQNKRDTKRKKTQAQGGIREQVARHLLKGWEGAIEDEEGGLVK